VPYTSVDVNFLLDVMNRARSRVNIVILDACRNNPFARSFRSGSSGLAQMDAPSGTLIAYATAPGRVASDGAGEHGLYTQHLLTHLTTPGLPVEILFKRVREGVERETKSQQVPWESSSLKGDFYFTAAAPVAAPAPAAPPPAPAPLAAPAGPDPALLTELAFWDAIKTSSVAADYLAYLETYPKGRFATLARSRANSLKAAVPKPAAVAAAPPAPVAAPAPARPPAQLAAVAPTPVASGGRMPALGERWTYRYTDRWRPAVKADIIHTVTEIRPHEVIETLSTVVGGRTYVGNAASPLQAEIREWKLGEIAFREFAPFAPAFELPRPGSRLDDFRTPILQDTGRVDWVVKSSVTEEEVTVPAGRFQAIKVVLEGGGAGQVARGLTSFQMTVWYAPQSKRYVKATFLSYVRTPGSSNSLHHNDLYELVSAPR